MIKGNSLTFNSRIIHQKFSTALINSYHFISVRHTNKSLFAFFLLSTTNFRSSLIYTPERFQVKSLVPFLACKKAKHLSSYEVVQFLFSETSFKSEMLSQEMYIFNCPVIIAFIHKRTNYTHFTLHCHWINSTMCAAMCIYGCTIFHYIIMFAMDKKVHVSAQCCIYNNNRRLFWLLSVLAC